PRARRGAFERNWIGHRVRVRELLGKATLRELGREGWGAGGRSAVADVGVTAWLPVCGQDDDPPDGCRRLQVRVSRAHAGLTLRERQGAEPGGRHVSNAGGETHVLSKCEVRRLTGTTWPPAGRVVGRNRDGVLNGEVVGGRVMGAVGAAQNIDGSDRDRAREAADEHPDDQDAGQRMTVLWLPQHGAGG